jgi:hypothetical protein
MDNNGRMWQIAAFVIVVGLVFVLGVGIVLQRLRNDPAPAPTDEATASEVAVPSGPAIEPPITIPAEEVASTTSSSVPDTDPETFFVSSLVGDDGNDGQTAEAPWLSLQTGLDRLKPGQTLYLMDGEYNEVYQAGYIHYLIETDGTPDAWITIAAAAGHEPVITPNTGNGLVLRGSYIEVAGLTVRGEGFDVDNPYGWGLLVSDAHHIRFVGNTVSGMPVGGISAIETANVEILDNVIFDNSFWGTEQGSGISIWHARDHGTEAGADGYHDKVIGNVAYRNENKVFSRWAPGQDLITDGNGIIIDESIDLGYTGRMLVANNVLFDNGGRGVIVNKSARIDIVFNTMYQNSRTPDLAGGPVEIGARRSSDIRILNNLAWSRSNSSGIRIAETDGAVVGGNVFITDSTTGVETARDLVSTDDPGLVAANLDPALADFRPRPDSILIDRAIEADPIVGFDAGGNPRPSTGADVGAFELTAP